LRKAPAALEITAFLNLIVVLVPFLLSTAVFSRLAVLELSLPPPAGGPAEALAVERLQLEVVVRADGIEVADRIGGRIGRVERGPHGDDELRALSTLLLQLKQRYPAELQASVLAEPDTGYERLVQVMATVRATTGAQPLELFPRIAVGDAPLRRGRARAVGPRRRRRRPHMKALQRRASRRPRTGTWST
jgi:biopolymer transport protein ExbD